MIDEDCPSPTISALSSKSRTIICIVLNADFSSLVQALTRSDFRSDSVRDADETSDGTEENKGMVLVLLVVPWGANAVATPIDVTAAKDDSSIMIVRITKRIVLYYAVV